MNRLITMVSGLAAVGLTIVACASSSTWKPPASFAEQVAMGQELFARHCAECHGDAGEGDMGPRLVGLDKGALPLDPPSARKVRKSRFVTVADVLEFVLANMPAKKPNSVTHDEKLAILAFDLKANGIDLGQEPLTLAKARTLTIPR